MAVVAQGTFGCDTAQRLGDLASAPDLRFGSGDLHWTPSSYPALQPSADGIFNRRGLASGATASASWRSCWSGSARGEVRAVVLLHDDEFSSRSGDRACCERSSQAVPFSLVLEPIPGAAQPEPGTARLPVATYLEETDFVVNHEGELRCYKKALEPPRGVKTRRGMGPGPADGRPAFPV